MYTTIIHKYFNNNRLYPLYITYSAKKSPSSFGPWASRCFQRLPRCSLIVPQVSWATGNSLQQLLLAHLQRHQQTHTWKHPPHPQCKQPVRSESSTIFDQSLLMSYLWTSPSIQCCNWFLYASQSKAVGREQDQLVISINIKILVPNDVFHHRIDLNLALEELKPVTVLSNFGAFGDPKSKNMIWTCTSLQRPFISSFPMIFHTYLNSIIFSPWGVLDTAVRPLVSSYIHHLWPVLKSGDSSDALVPIPATPNSNRSSIGRPTKVPNPREKKKHHFPLLIFQICGTSPIYHIPYKYQ